MSSCGVPPQVSGRPPCDSPQATAAREELHAQQARSLQEKDRLRRRVRELDEKADELQLQLFQREGQLLAVKGRLRRRLEIRVPSSDLEDSSPRNSQEVSVAPGELLGCSLCQTADPHIPRRYQAPGCFLVLRCSAGTRRGLCVLPVLPGFPQEAGAQEGAAQLHAGRGGLGEHHRQRQHRHRGLLAAP